MIRKVTLALAAVAALGVTALAPTTASAGWKHKYFGHKHFYVYGPAYVAYGYSCWKKKWVYDPYYGWILKKVYVCY